MKWLHVSDLHYNHNSSLMTQMGLDKLLTFVEEQNITADHLFMTGDFRHAREQRAEGISDDDEAELAVDYILKIADSARLPHENIHIVPGNHDIERVEKGEPLDHIKSIENKYFQNGKEFSQSDLDDLYKQFGFFDIVCKKLKERVPKIDIPWMQQKKGVYVRHFDDFSVIYVNTCLFCHEDSSREGHLLVDTTALYKCVKEINEHISSKMVFVLGHHELQDLKNKNRKDLIKVFKELRCGAVTYLCGDEHVTWAQTEEKLLEITAGCLLVDDGVQETFLVGSYNNQGFIEYIQAYSFMNTRWDISSHITGDIRDCLNLVNQKLCHNREIDKKEHRIQSHNQELNVLIRSSGKAFDSYSTVMNRPYGLLITDITGVLFDINNGKEEFPNDIVDVFSQLAMKHISICFTTGRGRSGARNLLFNLAQKIIEVNDAINWESLSNEWECITHNGAYLLTTPDKSKSGFLANSEILCNKEHDRIQKRISEYELNREYEAIVKRCCKRWKKKIPSYEVTKEPLSVRFSLEAYEEGTDYDKIFKETEAMFKDNFAEENEEWYYTRGRYQNKHILEANLANKKDAVRDYIALHRSIDRLNIIRIGDSGAKGESDYSFLTDGPSFSVGSINSDNKDTCFPVINEENMKILQGTQATVYILSHLKFYPSLCLNQVGNKEKYIMSFAKTINEANKKANEIYSFYNNRLSWMDFMYGQNGFSWNISKIFDQKSGAIAFTDYEWIIIQDAIKTAEVFSNERSREYRQIDAFSDILIKKNNERYTYKPNMKYFMKTDTHIIFRGALYYPFLFKKLKSGIQSDEIKVGEWVKSFYCWSKDAFEFSIFFREALTKLIEDETQNSELGNGPKGDEEESSKPVSYLARKLIIGGIDNIRNILLVYYNFYIRQEVINRDIENTDFLLEVKGGIDTNLNNCHKIYSLLYECVTEMYFLLFESRADMEVVNRLVKLMDQASNCIKERVNEYRHFFEETNMDSSLVYPETKAEFEFTNEFFTETFQRWRESDCFVENIAAIETYISKLNECNEKLVFWGVPYGSLEHPIIAIMLSRKHGYKTHENPRYVILHGKYEERHQKEFSLNYRHIIDEPDYSSNRVQNILIDDTLTTAKTLDLSVRCLSIGNVAVNGVIVVRYAGINRMQHYLSHLSTNNEQELAASAPDISKFFNMISGLVAEAPYSRLYQYGTDNSNKPYESELGVFDKARHRICNYLITNYDMTD